MDDRAIDNAIDNAKHLAMGLYARTDVDMSDLEETQAAIEAVGSLSKAEVERIKAENDRLRRELRELKETKQ